MKNLETLKNQNRDVKKLTEEMNNNAKLERALVTFLKQEIKSLNKSIIDLKN